VSGRWKWVIPGAMLASVLVASIQRWQEGPPPQADWRGLVEVIDRSAGPADPIVFAPDPFWGTPAFGYLALAHYAPDSRRPIMMLSGPANSAALAQLRSYRKVWLVISVSAPKQGLLPGWREVWSTGRPGSGFVAEMLPITSLSPTFPATR
jgi:hypothetical protein